MKIAVLNNWVPFVSGGAEYLADALVDTLRDHGHQAAVFRLPFNGTRRRKSRRRCSRAGWCGFTTSTWSLR